MEKFKPHKNCSCKMCRSGKTKRITQILERAFRHRAKQKLRAKVEEFENEVDGGGYFD